MRSTHFHSMAALILAGALSAAPVPTVSHPMRRNSPRTGKTYPYSSERQNTREKRKRLRAEAALARQAGSL